MTAYCVRLEVFEGPLDLLLTLIRREQLDITAVALAQVTHQYVAYVGQLESIDPAALAAFCEVASTLMLIKSRALLPRPPAPPIDEDADAQLLVERLRAYRQYKQAAEVLQRREHGGLRAFVRSAPPPDLPPRLEPSGVSLVDLVAAFEAALAEVEAEPAPPPAAAPPPRLRLADRLADIRDLLRRQGRVTFREALLGARRDREYVVVSFLAVLELLRRGWVRATQPELFGEIVLELRADAEAFAEAVLESFIDDAD